jgi:hypothetical protein
MSQAGSSAGHGFEMSTEDLPTPDTGISRADTLPEIEETHAKGLSKLEVSDGDFHTQAKVCGESFPSRTRED